MKVQGIFSGNQSATEFLAEDQWNQRKFFSVFKKNGKVWQTYSLFEWILLLIMYILVVVSNLAQISKNGKWTWKIALNWLW